MDNKFKETNTSNLLMEYLYKTTEITASQATRLEVMDRAIETIVAKLSNGINSKIDFLGLNYEKLYSEILMIKGLEERQTKIEEEKLELEKEKLELEKERLKLKGTKVNLAGKIVLALIGSAWFITEIVIPIAQKYLQ